MPCQICVLMSKFKFWYKISFNVNINVNINIKFSAKKYKNTIFEMLFCYSICVSNLTFLFF